MVFSSIIFLFFFLPVALALYYASPRAWRFVVLTACSYFFYAWHDPRFLLLLLWVTFVDFTVGNLLGRRSGLSQRARRTLLALSLANSIGLLVYFKYAVMAHGLAGGFAEMLGGAAWPALAIVLPAGISFYTFESISYVVDVYRGDARPAGDVFARAVPVAARTLPRRIAAQGQALVSFACYLAQFPHLVAGPIIRYQELERQLHRPRSDVHTFTLGVMLLSFGLAKKVLVANSLAAPADAGFAEWSLTTLDTWTVVVAYAFQLYFDFSGYSDMACGLALMLGFQFPRNFDAPYLATSITDFWRRWHMTLSRWLRDYLYISLGGNRQGMKRTYINLMLTMILGGLWHGASLNFAAWGLWHGTLLSIERAIQTRRAQRLPSWSIGIITRVIKVAATFTLVCVGWVFFRSETIPHATVFLHQMFSPHDSRTALAVAEIIRTPRTYIAIAIAAVLSFAGVQAWTLCQKVTLTRAVLALILFAISAAVLTVQSSNPFLYFRF